MSVKSVYMMTDLEGVAGVDDWDPRHRDDATTAKGVYDRAEMQRLLTGEVNAAAEGLFAAGVEEIIINDAHGAGAHDFVRRIDLRRKTGPRCQATVLVAGFIAQI